MIVIKTAETITTLIQSWGGLALPIHLLEGYRAEVLDKGCETRIVENSTEKVFAATTHNDKLNFMILHYIKDGVLFTKYGEQDRKDAIKIWLAIYATIKTINFIYNDAVDESSICFSFNPHIQDNLNLVNPEWRINLFNDGEKFKIQLLEGESHLGVIDLSEQRLLKRIGGNFKFETGGVSLNVVENELKVFIPAKLEHNCYDLTGDTLILALLEWHFHEVLADDRYYRNGEITRQLKGRDQATVYRYTKAIMEDRAKKFLN